jgi:hypothetical protein
MSAACNRDSPQWTIFATDFLLPTTQMLSSFSISRDVRCWKSTFLNIFPDFAAPLEERSLRREPLRLETIRSSQLFRARLSAI